MSLQESPSEVRSRLRDARWDDLEVFSAIVDGLRLGKSLQQIAEDPNARVGGSRMLYFRLGRLESALGRRLVDRRPWGRDARLTEAGEALAAYVSQLLGVRRQLHEAFAEPEVPVLRIATHATLISSLFPAAVRESQRRRGPKPLFHLDLLTVTGIAEALAAVNEGRADAGLHLVFPEFERLSLPRNVRHEPLGRTEVLVLCHPAHRFAERARAGGASATVHLDELADECVITRGVVDARLLPRGTRARRISVQHSLDKLAYVRLGIGVTLFPRLAYELLASPTELRGLPLRPRIAPVLTLLRPRKRSRPLAEPVEEFLADLRSFGLAATRVHTRAAR